MATGWNPLIATKVVNALCISDPWAEPDAIYVALHTGEPGPGGTTNAFGDTTRQLASFTGATAGVTTTTGDITWTNVSAGGTLSHVSAWSAVTAGTFQFSASLSVARPVGTGEDFTIRSADLDIALTPIAT